MTDLLVPGAKLAFGSFTGSGTWDELIVPSVAKGGMRWGRLRIVNTTNVRIEYSFDGSTVHGCIDAGDKEKWDVLTAPLAGTVYVRAEGTAPASGDVHADGQV